MKPDISVVIPLYNKERYIQRAIDSVLNQTFQNFECIIVDSSTDRSTDVVKKNTDPRIVHRIDEKSTAAAARNSGVKSACSDFIAFLDADDEWQPDHLGTLLHLIQKFPDAGLFATPYVKIRPDGRPMVMLFYGIPKPPWEGYIPDYLKTSSYGDEPVHSSSCAVSREVFLIMGGFPEELRYGEDQILWGKISLHYPVAFSWSGLTIYHTEALGRICNEIHIIEEHPFSTYLRRELESGTIPPEKIQRCHTYIRRKRYGEIFSRLIIGEGAPPCENSSASGGSRSDNSATDQKKSWIFIGIFRRTLIRLYHSSLHDAIRRVLCVIFSCYNLEKQL